MLALEQPIYWVIPDFGHTTLPDNKVRIIVCAYCTTQDAVNCENALITRHYDLERVGEEIVPTDYQTQVKDLLGDGTIITL